MDSNTIKAIRRELGLTQSQMAALLNASQTTIAKYENNASRPSGDILKKLEQLNQALSNEADSKQIKGLIQSTGGVAAAAGFLGMSSALLSGSALGLAGVLGGSCLFGPIGLLAGGSGLAMYRILRNIFEQKDHAAITGIPGAESTSTVLSPLSDASLALTRLGGDALPAGGAGMAAGETLLSRNGGGSGGENGGE